MNHDNIISFQQEYAEWRKQRAELQAMLSADGLTPEDTRALQSLCGVYDRALQHLQAHFREEILTA